MKDKWLNLILLLTNRIYSRKQDILKRTGLGIIANVFVLIFLEIYLAIISLPLYLGVKPSSVTAYLEDKGAYEKVAYDYSLRRILTLTGLAIILLIWIVKLSLIVFTPKVSGPLQLYNISNLRPADMINEPTVISEIGIQTAVTDEKMIVPELKEVARDSSGGYVFRGTGNPNSVIVLLLSDNQVIIYSDNVDANGNWEITHSQKEFKLGIGNHAIVLFNYDKSSEKRSNFSQEKYFKVQTSIVDALVENADNFTNYTIGIIIVFGVGLMFLVT